MGNVAKSGFGFRPVRDTRTGGTNPTTRGPEISATGEALNSEKTGVETDDSRDAVLQARVDGSGTALCSGRAEALPLRPIRRARQRTAPLLADRNHLTFGEIAAG